MLLRRALMFLSWVLSLGSDEGLCQVCLYDPKRGHRAGCPYGGRNREPSQGLIDCSSGWRTRHDLPGAQKCHQREGDAVFFKQTGEPNS